MTLRELVAKSYFDEMRASRKRFELDGCNVLHAGCPRQACGPAEGRAGQLVSRGSAAVRIIFTHP